MRENIIVQLNERASQAHPHAVLVQQHWCFEKTMLHQLVLLIALEHILAVSARRTGKYT